MSQQKKISSFKIEHKSEKKSKLVLSNTLLKSDICIYMYIIYKYMSLHIFLWRYFLHFSKKKFIIFNKSEESLLDFYPGNCKIDKNTHNGGQVRWILHVENFYPKPFQMEKTSTLQNWRQVGRVLLFLREEKLSDGFHMYGWHDDAVSQEIWRDTHKKKWCLSKLEGNNRSSRKWRGKTYTFWKTWRKWQ